MYSGKALSAIKRISAVSAADEENGVVPTYGEYGKVI